MKNKGNKSATECARKANDSKGEKNTNQIPQKGKGLSKKEREEGLELMSVFGDIYWI